MFGKKKKRKFTNINGTFTDKTIGEGEQLNVFRQGGL